MTTTIRQSNFQQLSNMAISEEGLVFLGTGGKIEDWIEGVTGLLKDEGIKLDVYAVYVVTTTGGRTDTLMMFDWSKLEVGKLAIWRITFGDCSWLTDYVANYADQHGVERDYSEDEEGDWMLP